MLILVTGCAGFIGWKVCEFLLSEGHTVIGVDNLNDAYDVRLKYWRLAKLERKEGFRFHRLDICDREALRQLFGSVLKTHRPGSPGFGAIINLAARAGVRQSVLNPWAYFETNVTGTLNLLELCREFGVSKFVLASTSSVYGATHSLPFREDANTDQPLSPYAASKKAAEALCYAYHHLYGFDVAVLRYFTVYGPAGRPDMSLFRFVQWIFEGRPVIVYGDGTQSRDFTYVDDIALGTIAALRHLMNFGDRFVASISKSENEAPSQTGPIFEIINLGSDRPVVLIEAIRFIENLVGKKAQIVFEPRHSADTFVTWADIKKARTVLNWEPITKFQDGLQQLVNWYKENREWAKDVPTDQ
ncbi:MAG: GDP-mannose 4,6-dehydratase [Thermoplasmatales archaeon]